MVDLKSLAEQLGVSPSTVSRALNGYPHINEQTRRRVEVAAHAAGYVPNPSARALAGRDRRSENPAKIVGLLVTASPIENYDLAFSMFMAGLVAEAETFDCSITLAFPSSADRLPLSGLASSRTVVVQWVTADDARLEQLTRLHVPCVVHGRPGTPMIPFVDVDNRTSLCNATAFLIEHGHRRIGFLNADPRYIFANDRLRGYRDAHQRSGLVCDPHLVMAGPMTEAWGEQAACALLSRPGPPTAIICGSMLLAAGATRGLRQTGLRIPADCSVLAFDDMVPALAPQSFDPPVTTLEASIHDQGRLVARMAARTAPASQGADGWTTMPKLRIRASTAHANFIR